MPGPKRPPVIHRTVVSGVALSEPEHIFELSERCAGSSPGDTFDYRFPGRLLLSTQRLGTDPSSGRGRWYDIEPPRPRFYLATTVILAPLGQRTPSATLRNNDGFEEFAIHNIGIQFDDAVGKQELKKPQELCPSNYPDALTLLSSIHSSSHRKPIVFSRHQLPGDDKNKPFVASFVLKTGEQRIKQGVGAYSPATVLTEPPVTSLLREAEAHLNPYALIRLKRR